MYLVNAQERRPNAIAGGFNNGRDFFAQQDRTDNGEPLLSVEDVDIGNGLKRELRNNNCQSDRIVIFCEFARFQFIVSIFP